MKLLALAALSTLVAAHALACPPQNENLFLSVEFEGQENLVVGHIDTSNATVSSDNINFNLFKAVLNGNTICDESSRPCDFNHTKLKNGALADTDKVILVFKTNLNASADETYTFTRNSAARNQGDKCRPIFSH